MLGNYSKLFFGVIFFISSIYAHKFESFVLITTLYNETNVARRAEYITCLDNNLKNPCIDTIHILYDTARDEGSLELLNYLKEKNLVLEYIVGRPTYQYCFDLANKMYPDRAIILANADIYFNHTLDLLRDYDLHNKFLAITRWDLLSDGSVALYDNIGSQDAWIFNTPLKTFDRANFEIGTVHCDPLIAGYAWLSGLEVINPCFSVRCCHCHLSDLRQRGDCDIRGHYYAMLPFNWLDVDNYSICLSRRSYEQLMTIIAKKEKLRELIDKRQGIGVGEHMKMYGKKVTCYVGKLS